MNITETYQVRPVEYDDCKEWLLHKHYAHRIPCISYAFGLYNEELRMVGCCTYGLPANRSLAEGAVEQEWADKLYELNRLVVDEGLPRNVLSFFVAQTLKMLPKPLIIVSYADDGQGHHGYIYQATNWAYTGLSQLRGDWKVKGLDNVHNRHLLDGIKPKEGQSVKEALMEKYGDRVYFHERSRKHRYFQFLGDKRQKKAMLKAFKYPFLPYPKGDNTRYDASYQCEPQGCLF